ncbi:uncharacterized protein LOC131144477 isoform X2 [Malania oleifera]|uniref:uncharacterized protein LOC131144477 isoform X2 n=1 Tax=Malania oleifera TaxID=397392 RepID=UPI0025AE3D63|nr:uncharacterized protein LOC131144477 isoform X2 [Malania oleifera]
MALPSSFRERLQLLEATRNQRLSLLQAEKELQANKSLLLVSKLSNFRSTELRCLMLEQKIASQNFQISSLKSEIACLNANYQNFAQQLSEAEELEKLEKDKQRYYDLKGLEMEEFRGKVEYFAVDCRAQVQELMARKNELKSSFVELQGNNGNLSNSAIAAAERRKSELLAMKENLDMSLASNYQLRAQLQKQLRDILVVQSQERRKPSVLSTAPTRN